MARTLAERLTAELNKIRAELLNEVSKIKPDDFGYKPAPDMKSYVDLLHEIGWIEAETVTILTERKFPSEEDCQDSVRKSPPQALLSDLNDVRAHLLTAIENSTEAEMMTPVSAPAEWEAFFGTREIEPVELVRWVARHDYYHLGQIITYRWVLGHNPYKRPN